MTEHPTTDPAQSDTPSAVDTGADTESLDTDTDAGTDATSDERDPQDTFATDSSADDSDSEPTAVDSEQGETASDEADVPADRTSAVDAESLDAEADGGTEGTSGERAAQDTTADASADAFPADDSASEATAPVDSEQGETASGEADVPAGDAVRGDGADADVVPGAEDYLPPGQTEVPVGDEVVIDDDTMRRAIEAILMVTDEPLPVLTLARAVGRPTGDVTAALAELSGEYTEQGRGFDLREIGGGWRYYTRPEAAAFVERFVLDGQQARLTQAALETLSVVAYKQPVSRARVSAIRGVNVDGVMRTLIARGLVEEAGADTESQATLYRTTSFFLERMGMQSLDDLPELAPYLPDMDDIEDELAAQSLPPVPEEAAADSTTPAEPEEDSGPLENDLAPEPPVTTPDPEDLDDDVDTTPEASAPETGDLETHEPETHEPETHEPETHEPGTGESLLETDESERTDTEDDATEVTDTWGGGTEDDSAAHGESEYAAPVSEQGESDDFASEASEDEHSEYEPVQADEAGADVSVDDADELGESEYAASVTEHVEAEDAAPATEQVESGELQGDDSEVAAPGDAPSRWYPYDQTAEEIGSADDVPGTETASTETDSTETDSTETDSTETDSTETDRELRERGE
ncbi:hypothetical protein GCM10029976_086090 [Kribbella albertanoniae]